MTQLSITDSLHNTTNLPEKEAREVNKQFSNQEEYILEVFRKAKRNLSPSDVYRLIGMRWPITSVRRAISNLTQRNQLFKTEQKKPGMFNKPEHLWRS